jgi:hypothetical protein
MVDVNVSVRVGGSDGLGLGERLASADRDGLG